MSWDSLIQAVSDVVTTNGNNDITGELLRNLVNENIIPKLGADRYLGIADLDTVPPAEINNSSYYLANKVGVYANINQLSIVEGETAIFFYENNTWQKRLIVAPTLMKHLSANIIGDRNFNNKDLFQVPTSFAVSNNEVTVTSAAQSYLRWIPDRDYTNASGWTITARIEVFDYVVGSGFGTFLISGGNQLTITGNGVYEFKRTTNTESLTPSSVIGLGIFGTPSQQANFKFRVKSYAVIPSNLYFDGINDYLQEQEVLGYSAKALSAEISEYARKTVAAIPNLNGLTNEAQIDPSQWIKTKQNDTLTPTGDIKLIATGDNSQIKIQVPVSTTVGNRYLAVLHVNNMQILHPNCTGLRFFNFSQNIFDTGIESNALYVQEFVSNNAGNVIQVLANGSLSSIPQGTEIVSFQSNIVAVMEYSDELATELGKVALNYKGGALNFLQNIENLKGLQLPVNSFREVSNLNSRINALTNLTVPAWTSINAQSTNVVNQVQNGVFTLGGTVDFGTATVPRLWAGFDIQPANYATENKRYAIILQGDIIGTNISNLLYTASSGSTQIVAQDIDDNVLTEFSELLYYNYNAGQTSNSRYTYINVARRSTSIDDVVFTANFNVFSVFEEVEGFAKEDYIRAANGGYIEALNVPKDLATENFVTTQINQATGNLSRLTPNDLVATFDVEMILSGGQSLNVGGGAASALNDFKNIPTFAGGNSLFNRDFSTQAEKDLFFGTSFIDLETHTSNEDYAPINAAATTMLSLINSENKVDVSDFGFQLMPFTWGVSGSSITTMEQGTTAYNNMIEVVTKAKEFANKEGKTFGVRSMNWYHGEADRFQTKQWYYDRMSQLFIDVNNDIKAITGQTADINFFTYQTSGWLGRNIGGASGHPDINIQEAQLQVAIDFANVYMCGAMYQFDYNDFYHPADRAVIGLQTGVAMKRVNNDSESFKTFRPISNTVVFDGTNYYTQLKFDVPTKPARFDISGDLWHNPRGKQVNFGFELLDGATEIQTAEPFIVKGDTVVLTSTVNPVGKTIRYAVNGHDGGGNLCDSQNIIVRNKGVDYVIDNFAVCFSEYVVS